MNKKKKLIKTESNTMDLGSDMTVKNPYSSSVKAFQNTAGAGGDAAAAQDNWKVKYYYKYPVDNWEEYLTLAKNRFDTDFPVKRSPERRLDEFERLRTVGTGSFGRVLLVREISNDTYWAMKILDKDNIMRNKQRDHVLNEQRVLLSLKFPFCVYVKYSFKDNNNLYLIMPFIPGGEMFTILRSLGKFSESITKFYAAQAVLALEYLHNLSLVYRDIKPENLLIDSDGYLKLTDFSFCKPIKNGRTYSLCGTPEYLAPEIIRSKGYGFTSDWWSLGVLIFEMAYGQPPFLSEDHARLYEKILRSRYSMPATFSSPLKQLVSGLLQIDISNRLGCMKNGVQDVKEQVFFQGVNWLDLVNKRFRSPMQPKIKGQGDATNFDQFSEKPIIVGSIDKYAREFVEF